MTIKTYREAIIEAMILEMKRDEKVFVIGEDISGGRGCEDFDGEAAGGPMGLTQGLWDEFGAKRVIDTPISETAIMGAAAGAALSGLRPIAELMFSDFFGVCFDQIYNQAAKFRFMYGDQGATPLVIRTMIGAGIGCGPQHSQSPYSIFANIPGLKVVTPSNPYDAKGLLISSIRDNDPVIFCEHKALLGIDGEVPDESYEVPLGKGKILKEGDDISIVAIGQMVGVVQNCIKSLEEKGISAEIIDPRSLSPFDDEMVYDSVEKTGRLLVLDESNPVCSFGSWITSMVSEEVFSSLKAPTKVLTPPHCPVPAAPNLEAAYLPDMVTIISASENLKNYS
tara:strand:+ start:1042 stop:2055 length:1014 start_codon:yes stop_codon:yes gene_type:complete